MSEPYPGLLPVGAFTLEVLPEVPQLALEGEGTIRLTLAAIDPDNAEGDKPSTLRILRRVYNDDDEDLISYSDDEDEEDDEEEEEEEKPKKKGSKKASKDSEDADEDDDEEDDDEDDEEDDFEISRTVVCTLSPKTSFQQTIDIVINASEDVIFEVTGSYPIHLTGNYVLHPFDEEDEDDSDEESDEDEDYDMSPDEDELDFSNRIQEMPESESEEEEPAKPEPKQKNKKRAVEEAPAAETKSKKQKAEDKKVAFTKELEQGPTGSTSPAAAKKTTKKLAGGVTIEDRKVGAGPTAQPGDKVSVRYIGKLLNGQTFDSNTKGKPFSFKLGSGEVIKGWDVGVAGMSVKGERRIVIPAASAYGKKALPGIPANSTLTFDVKLVGIK